MALKKNLERVRACEFSRHFFESRKNQWNSMKLHGSQLYILCAGLRQLTHVKLAGGSSAAGFNGVEFSASSGLTYLLLDDYCFKYSVENQDIVEHKRTLLRMYSGPNSTTQDDCYILKYCKQIQHLSMKGSTWSVFNNTGCVFETEPIPQELLIKMVRRHPTLHW